MHAILVERTLIFELFEDGGNSATTGCGRGGVRVEHGGELAVAAVVAAVGVDAIVPVFFAVGGELVDGVQRSLAEQPLFDHAAGDGVHDGGAPNARACRRGSGRVVMPVDRRADGYSDGGVQRGVRHGLVRGPRWRTFEIWRLAVFCARPFEEAPRGLDEGDVVGRRVLFGGGVAVDSAVLHQPVLRVGTAAAVAEAALAGALVASGLGGRRAPLSRARLDA